MKPAERYHFDLTCCICGSDLEHIAGSNPGQRTRQSAIAQCTSCKRMWGVEVNMKELTHA